MKKEMLFGISFFFAVWARSAAIRFAGVRCRECVLRRLKILRARTGYDRIVWPCKNATAAVAVVFTAPRQVLGRCGMMRR
ncbi:hypothetical protein [Alistipes finegoldii]|uniref:hypothetical protein n=1 Tax=Alistipes finegoldii TaxID=214856 RepID=UPI00189FECB8|nr:hypothetical protein [Alistipes finegoldii]